MTKKDTGGLAFPLTEANYEERWAEQGMSLRDYFAGKALSNITVNGMIPGWQAEVAWAAYSLADAMIKERNKEAQETSIRDAINAAFEEAAQVCDAQALEPECPERAQYCAEEIRALKTKEPT